MTKTIDIGGVEVTMRCSALVPRLYRRATGRDLMRDMAQLRENYNNALRASITGTEEEKQANQLNALDLEIFENLAWAFCRDADPEHVPDNPDEWLDQFPGIFSIYSVFPAMVDLWNDTNKQTSIPAKKTE